ncbi:MAG: EamA family transporter [Lachnospiraceae bacterium]|nr:EamA family transporter [Lachnospiraceae bacterium]
MKYLSGKKPHIMMISALLIVGSIGVFRRFIPLSSSMLAFLRGIIGAASLFLFAIITKKKIFIKLPAKKMILMILTGVVLGVNWILLFEAYNYTTISKATLAYYMQPTILLFVSPLIFKEKLTLKKVICAALALAGMVLVSGVLELNGAASNDLRGVLLGLGAAVFYTLVVILNKINEGVDAYEKSVFQLLSAAIVLIPYLIIRNEFAGIALDSRGIILVLIVGIIHTGLVYILFFGSMSGLKAQTISVLSYIDPITAMIVSALLLKEGLSVLALLGAVLIICSSLVAENDHLTPSPSGQKGWRK